MTNHICLRTPNCEGWFYVKPHYRCSYCDGIIRDKDYVRKIVDFNTPTNIQNRKDIIDGELLEALTIKLKSQEKNIFYKIMRWE